MSTDLNLLSFLTQVQHGVIKKYNDTFNQMYPDINVSTDVVTKPIIEELMSTLRNKLDEIYLNNKSQSSVNLTNISTPVKSLLSERNYDADISDNSNSKVNQTPSLDNNNLDNTENYYADTSHCIFNELSINVNDVDYQMDRIQSKYWSNREANVRNTDTSSGVHSALSNNDDPPVGNDDDSDTSSIQCIIPVFGVDSDDSSSTSSVHDGHDCATRNKGVFSFPSKPEFYRICYDNESEMTTTAVSDASNMSLIDESYEFDGCHSRKSFSWLNKDVHNCSCSFCAKRDVRCPFDSYYDHSHSFSSKSSFHAKFQSTPRRKPSHDSMRSHNSSDMCESCVQARTKKLCNILQPKT